MNNKDDVPIMDDETIHFRDKIAVALLTGYLSSYGSKNDFLIKDALINPKSDPDQIQAIGEKIRAAYKMADMIRKIRLEVFS